MEKFSEKSRINLKLGNNYDVNWTLELALRIRKIFKLSNSKTIFEKTLTYKKSFKNKVTCNGHGIERFISRN